MTLIQGLLNGMAVELQHAAFLMGGAIAVVAVVCLLAYWLVWR